MEFYNKHAKTPKEDMRKARHELDIHLKRFEVELRKKGLCKKLEFTGSSFEGLKITSDGLEFDVMCILPGKDIELIEIDECPGFANLASEAARQIKFCEVFWMGQATLFRQRKLLASISVKLHLFEMI